MSKKEEFVKYVNELMENQTNPITMNEDAKLYWEGLKAKNDVEKPLFTDNGKLILKHMQDISKNCSSQIQMWKAREIAEGMLISSKAVSGAMRKLITDGYVEKVGESPVVYSITEAGKNIKLD